MMTRAHPRFATAVEVTLVTADGEQSGQTSNVSRGGLCAEVPGEVPLGVDTVVRLSLLFPDDNRSEPIEIGARAVWCTPIDSRYQVGIQFTKLSPQASHDLSLFLRFLAQGSQTP